jgi:2-dehydropantoate 2-reductase
MGMLFYTKLSQCYGTKAISLLSRSSKSLPNSLAYTDLFGLSCEIKVNPAGLNELSQADIILSCVKSYQVEGALSPLLDKLSPQCGIILMHNGMGSTEVLAPRLTEQQALLTMLTTQASLKINNQHIIHTGAGNSDLGLVQGKRETGELKKITETLNLAIGGVYWADDIKLKQWTKLAINCVINPLTALNKVKNGELIHAKYQPIIDTLLSEIITVAHCQHIHLDKQSLHQKITQVIINTAQNNSSMLQDVLNHRRTEIDYISGYLSRCAEINGVDAPENKKMWQLLSAL